MRRQLHFERSLLHTALRRFAPRPDGEVDDRSQGSVSCGGVALRVAFAGSRFTTPGGRRKCRTVVLLGDRQVEAAEPEPPKRPRRTRRGVRIRAITYSPGCDQYHRREGLNCCVRNGNRCFSFSMVTRIDSWPGRSVGKRRRGKGVAHPGPTCRAGILVTNGEIGRGPARWWTGRISEGLLLPANHAGVPSFEGRRRNGLDQYMVMVKVKPIGSLVRLSSTHCCAYTRRLSTS